MVTLLERPAIQAVETAVPAKGKVCGGLPYWQEQIAQIMGSYTPDNLQFFEVVFGAELQASIGNDPEHNKTWQPASGYIGEAISGFEYARIMGNAA